jgi:peptide/nickel transport system permease protein
MAAYLVRRLLLAVSAMAVVSFVAFVTFGLSFDPTGPMRLSPDQRPREFVLHHYHLSDPILVRYWLWVKGLLTHGFGTTISTNVSGAPPRLATEGEPIGPVIWHAAGLTAQLVGLALVLTAVASVGIGVLSARRSGSRLDVSTRVLTYVAASMPTFLIADLLRRAIVPNAHVAAFAGAPQALGGSWFQVGPPSGGLVDWFQHMTLPAAALALGLTAVYARYVRSAMLVSLSEPYTTVARGKGVPESRVVLHHALRNSLVPVTSLLSLEIGAVVGASLAADAVFNVGGLAATFLGALGAADPFELTALVVVTALLVSAFLLGSDLLVGALDPRARRR